jgi:DedD protein
MMFRNRFDDDEDDDLKGSEFTLGLGSLLGIFFGMVLLCGIFFGIGYTLGHGSSPLHVTNPSAATPATPPADTSASTAVTPGGAKPAAQQAAPPPPPAQPTPGQAATGTNPASGITTGTGLTTGAQPATVPQQSATAQPAPSQAATSTPQYMVQVAAVSRPQDAAVLVAALQQRGFQAVSRTEPQDHLMHVQIGPFATLAAANQMRARLMADGYNAILKP